MTTAACAWQLDDTRAQTSLGTAGLATVELLQPDRGVQFSLPSTVTPTTVTPSTAAALHILGVELEQPLDRSTLLDSYPRVDDLVATYAATATRPHRVQAYWKRQFELPAGVAAVIDLQLLTQTDLLDSDPRRTVVSRLSGCEVFKLQRSTTSPTLSPVECSQRSTTTLGRDAALACCLFRWPGSAMSYVEMVHPLDFYQVELRMVGNELQTTHHLFVDWLEKGVILRSRLRGALVERQNDVSLALDLYQQLCDSPPPLTT